MTFFSHFPALTFENGLGFGDKLFEVGDKWKNSASLIFRDATVLDIPKMHIY